MKLFKQGLVILLLWSVAFLVLGALIIKVRSAPGELRPFIELYWDAPATNEQVKAFRLYSTPDPAGTNWTLVTTLPGAATNYFVLPEAAARYYALTASNIWGETPFSSAAWTTPRPSSNGVFGVR